MIDPTPLLSTSTTPTTPLNTSTPSNVSNKRPLESAAAEFVENGWNLLSEVHEKKDYPNAQIKSMPLGDSKGIQFISC
jgi:hypothetical protein